MAEYLTNTADLTAVADAIRVKGGISDPLVYPDGFVTAIQAIETGSGGGSDELVNSLVERTISGTYVNNTVTIIGRYGLAGCTKLTSVVLPAVRTTDGNSMNGCSALTKADFSNLKTIRYSTFYSNKKLVTLIIRTQAVANLEKTSAFKDTPIESGTGYVYVPSALVDSYKSATNWSTYANQIRAIEDYPDITGG